MGHCKDSLGAAPNGGLRQRLLKARLYDWQKRVRAETYPDDLAALRRSNVP